MNLKDKEIFIRKIKESDFEELHQVSYVDNLEWMKYNGPYFNDPVYTKDKFINEIAPKYYLNKDNQAVILYNNKIIGHISYHFADGSLKQWLEFGIVIYDRSNWGQKIGKRSCKLWIDYIFRNHPIPHVGFTTWSGNERMMRLGESLNMTLEARIRKVRYLNKKYYDSIKYGILRQEFYES